MSATKKIHTALDVERIYCTVTCPECGGTVNMKMRNPVTRKTCPKCNRLTYCFTITPVRGYVHITAFTVGPNEQVADYPLDAKDIEVEEDSPNQEEEDTDDPGFG